MRPMNEQPPVKPEEDPSARIDLRRTLASPVALRRSPRLPPVPPHTRPTPSTSTTLADVKEEPPARPYANPSTDAELVDPFSDYLSYGLDLLMCGMNPGAKSAQVGLQYASPSNHFWKALAGSGLTDRSLHYSEGPLMPKLYGIGSTNLVPRRLAANSDLSIDEMKACVPGLLRKIAAHKPKIVAFNGKKIWEIVLLHLRDLPAPSTSDSDSDSPPRKKRQRPDSSTKMPKTEFGLQPVTLSFPPERDGEAREKLYFWSMPSTSGVVAQYQLTDKIKIFRLLKADVSRLASTPPTPLELPDDTVDYPVEIFFAPNQPAPGPNTPSLPGPDSHGIVSPPQPEDPRHHVNRDSPPHQNDQLDESNQSDARPATTRSSGPAEPVPDLPPQRRPRRQSTMAERYADFADLSDLRCVDVDVEALTTHFDNLKKAKRRLDERFDLDRKAKGKADLDMPLVTDDLFLLMYTRSLPDELRKIVLLHHDEEEDVEVLHQALVNHIKNDRVVSPSAGEAAFDARQYPSPPHLSHE
ncbi:hypothetical protein JCM5296_003009 [Sporobolomyces johnsonii]